jgi:hypothetical protein
LLPSKFNAATVSIAQSSSLCFFSLLAALFWSLLVF